jgi:hypothetical protein
LFDHSFTHQKNILSLISNIKQVLCKDFKGIQPISTLSKIIQNAFLMNENKTDVQLCSQKVRFVNRHNSRTVQETPSPLPACEPNLTITQDPVLLFRPFSLGVEEVDGERRVRLNSETLRQDTPCRL